LNKSCIGELDKPNSGATIARFKLQEKPGKIITLRLVNVIVLFSAAGPAGFGSPRTDILEREHTIN